MPFIIDITGQRFGRLTVIKQAGMKGHRMTWECLCDCGNHCVIDGVLIRRGQTKSCGCFRDDTRSACHTKHGHNRPGERTAVYRTWAHMIQRCTNPNCIDFPRYGGRGITVCEDWKRFENFLADMGDQLEGMTLDRIDNSGLYCKENCQWSTRKTQARNTRRNRTITHQGITLCVAEWAEKTGIPVNTINQRISRGWSEIEAITIPVGPFGFRRSSH